MCGVICEQDVHNVWSSAAGQQLAEWQHAWMVERAAREKADRLVNGMRMSLASYGIPFNVKYSLKIIVSKMLDGSSHIKHAPWREYA